MTKVKSVTRSKLMRGTTARAKLGKPALPAVAAMFAAVAVSYVQFSSLERYQGSGIGLETSRSVPVFLIAQTAGESVRPRAEGDERCFCVDPAPGSPLLEASLGGHTAEAVPHWWGGLGGRVVGGVGIPRGS